MLLFKKVRIHLTDEQFREVQSAIARNETITLEAPYVFRESPKINDNILIATIKVPEPPKPQPPPRKRRSRKVSS